MLPTLQVRSPVSGNMLPTLQVRLPVSGTSPHASSKHLVTLSHNEHHMALCDYCGAVKVLKFII